jgi:hypothetical protein
MTRTLSLWSSVLMRMSAAARLLGLWVRTPTRAWMRRVLCVVRVEVSVTGQQ